MLRKYDHILSLGYNCEVAFQFKTRFNFVESALFNWCYVNGEQGFLSALNDLNLLLAQGLEEFLAINMWECRATKVRFHGSRSPKELLDDKGNRLEKIIEAELNEVISRIQFLITKQQKLWESYDSQLYILLVKENDNEKARKFIQDVATQLSDKNKDADLLAVVRQSQLNELKQLENSHLSIRGISKLTPHNKVTDLAESDLKGWNAIFDEFQPKEILVQNKIYKFEKD